MQQVLVSQVTSTIIMKENHFTKGEKKRQGISINDDVLLVNKPEFDPKVPNWLLVYVSILPIHQLSPSMPPNNLSFLDAPA